jgi:HEAT repeat protein
MSTTVKSLTYRGDVKAAVGVGGTLVFTTVHPEGQPTGVYRIDVEKLALAVDPLPAGGTALAHEKDALWIAGSDRRIYQSPARGGTPMPLGQPLAAPPTALALLANDRLAALAGAHVVILSREDSAVRQTLELPEEGTCLAADPTGQWLAAGTAKGTVAVFDGEVKAEFVPSESAKLHDGAVTALLFEPEELRFLSAGADNKLLSTHARGKLEPEDRGKGSNHGEPITAIVWTPGDRFCTGSRDKTVKCWPRAGGKPVTLKDSVIKVTALTLVQLYKRPHLVVGCDDNSFRVFPIEEDGKFGDQSHRFNDAYAWARYEFTQDESRRRETALRALAGWNDTASIELISEQVGKDGDHVVRKLAAELLGQSSHPRAAKLLEQWLRHSDEAVRVAAFEGLRRHLGAEDLRPLDWALQVEKADVGRLAVRALEGLAARDDQALTRLMESLNHNTPEVRQAALAGLERVHAADSPEANLLALTSRHADLRRLTLVRLFQRKMLQHPRAQAALRWRTEDGDPEVRRTAFLLALHTRPKLVPALRARDPELHRQLFELETFTQDGAPDEKKTLPPRPRQAKLDLTDADYEPLLQATASRSLDTCLRGAGGLAVLGDSRAFGLLLQLSREPDAASRAEICRVLARHGDAAALLPLLALATAPEPQEKERRAEWEELACAALAGLADLGDPAARPQIVPLLQSKSDAIRKNAAFALSWVALPHHAETLLQALQHADPQVKYRAALGLAYAGNVYGSLALSDPAKVVLTEGERLVAAFALGGASEEPLVPWLDHGDAKLRNWALLLLMLLEMKAHQGTPARCLTCLSSAMPRVRLTAARGLENFADPAAFRDFVVELFNDRGDEPAWKVPAETVDAVAELLVFGSLAARVRTAQLLQYLGEKEQAPWNQAWAIHEGRFAKEIAALRQAGRPAGALRPRPGQPGGERLEGPALPGHAGRLAADPPARGRPDLLGAVERRRAARLQRRAGHARAAAAPAGP